MSEEGKKRIPENKEDDNFTEHLQRATRVVDQWPEWKQNLMTKSSMTAQTRRKKTG